MTRTILLCGLIAGLIVTVPMNLMIALAGEDHIAGGNSQLIGYSLMIVALSVIFLGVKHHRDNALGGVIKFLPAFLMGLGISAVAGVIYVIAWEITLSLTNHEFINTYTTAMIETQRAKGVSGAELQAFVSDMEEMRVMYANPLFRLPITFVEIFPVGLVISLISALLLRNSRFLPARRSPAAA